MKLIILRHAEAEAKEGVDYERKLTLHGREQAIRVGKFCNDQYFRPDLILTSPVVRACETAELFVAQFEDEITLMEQPWIACGMTPEIALKELSAYKRVGSLLLVGHEPDLGWLIATLLGIPHAEGVEVKKASLTCIHVEKIAAGAGTLEFFIPYELLSTSPVT
ncbi:MAG: phosphohistidine phosphatase SixA [Chthoniobacterales bacterium]|nr:phosphohistidine phosphatase SixA [Chthoniobacterales bacterium]